LHAKKIESSSSSSNDQPPIRKKKETTSSNSDEKVVEVSDTEETMVTEAELRAVWKRSGMSLSSFNTQHALMLLLNEEEDNDDYDDDIKDKQTTSLSYDDEPSSASSDSSIKNPFSSSSNSVSLTKKMSSSKQAIESNSGLDKEYIQKLKKTMSENDDVSKNTPDLLSSQSSHSKKRTNKVLNQNPVDVRVIPAGRSVGIDLGTTFSAVSLVELGRPKIIPVDGARITPSVVGYLQNGEVLVGESARRQLVANPQNSFASIKRVIGRSLEECEATGDNLVALHVDRSRSGEVCILKCPLLGRPLLPEEVSAEVLRKLIRAAQEHIGDEERITKAVITVPAYFLPNQCAATEKAGKLAGLEKVKLLREPEAAALAYGLARKSPQIVLVFDLGEHDYYKLICDELLKYF